MARSGVSAPSHHSRFSAAFTTNIAESSFRYTHVIHGRLNILPPATEPALSANPFILGVFTSEVHKFSKWSQSAITLLEGLGVEGDP